jgi:glycosyltransferase involved in cell wall biosynthesis
MNNGMFDYGRRIKKMSAANKNIKFMGTFDNREVASVFREIDVLIFPSIWQENSPLVIHEALIAGVLVITSNIGGITELVIDYKNGLLFKAGDVNDLYNKIMLIIRNPEMIKEISSSLSEIKDIDSHAKEIEKFYSKLIDDRKTGLLRPAFGGLAMTVI